VAELIVFLLRVFFESGDLIVFVDSVFDRSKSTSSIDLRVLEADGRRRSEEVCVNAWEVRV
jgi:hypothetical protein